MVRTDDEYVRYLREHQPQLYRDDVGGRIDSHYREHRYSISGGWHRHLAERVLQEAARHDALVVEGWQLFDCADALVSELKAKGHAAVQVVASEDRYHIVERQVDLCALVEWFRSLCKR